MKRNDQYEVVESSWEHITDEDITKVLKQETLSLSFISQAFPRSTRRPSASQKLLKELFVKVLLELRKINCMEDIERYHLGDLFIQSVQVLFEHFNKNALSINDKDQGFLKEILAVARSEDQTASNLLSKLKEGLNNYGFWSRYRSRLYPIIKTFLQIPWFQSETLSGSLETAFNNAKAQLEEKNKEIKRLEEEKEILTKSLRESLQKQDNYLDTNCLADDTSLLGRTPVSATTLPTLFGVLSKPPCEDHKQSSYREDSDLTRDNEPAAGLCCC